MKGLFLGIKAGYVFALAFTLAVAGLVAGAELTYNVHGQGGTVEQKDNIDPAKAETVVAASSDDGTIITRTYKPPSSPAGAHFVEFTRSNTRVTVVAGADAIRPIVLETDTSIKITATNVPTNAGPYPLMCQGNLGWPERNIIRVGSHWAAKTPDAARALAARAIWFYGKNVTEIAGDIDGLGYTTTAVSGEITKTEAIAQAPGKLVWYLIAHGVVDDQTEHFAYVNVGDPLRPEDLPDGLDYTVVFMNGCITADGNVANMFAKKFNAKAYLGWNNEASRGRCADFAGKFFGHLSNRTSVQAAYQAVLADYGTGSVSWIETHGHFTIIGDGTVIVDLK